MNGTAVNAYLTGQGAHRVNIPDYAIQAVTHQRGGFERQGWPTRFTLETGARFTTHYCLTFELLPAPSYCPAEGDTGCTTGCRLMPKTSFWIKPDTAHSSGTLPISSRSWRK